MGSYKERLTNDVYEYIRANGPSYSADIAKDLNPRYHGNLSAVSVSNVCKQLRGQGLVKLEREGKDSGQWVVE